MAQRGIPCLWMRGGTSKAACFLADDLPADPVQRDAVLLAVEKMDAARTKARAAGLPEPEFRGIDSRFCEKWNSQYDVQE